MCARRIHHHFQKCAVFRHHAASLTSRGAPKPTAVRTQKPARLRNQPSYAGPASSLAVTRLYPGGRRAHKTVLKLRPYFPQGPSTPPPPRIMAPSAASAVIRSHAEGHSLKQSLGTHPALRASGSFPAVGVRVRGMLCVVCVCLGVSSGLHSEAGAGPRTPAGGTHVGCEHLLSTPSLSRRLCWERRRQPPGSPTPAAGPPLDSGLGGLQASPGPSWARPGQKHGPAGPATWGETRSLQGQDIRPAWRVGVQEGVVWSPRLSRGSDTGKRGPRVSLLGQNQSSTTFLQQEFGRVTKTSEPQFSRL